MTTSRAPSPRTRSFVKDLVSVLPGAERVTRGHLTLEELAMAARDAGAGRVVIVGERKGNPSIIRVYEVADGPRLVNIVTFIIRGVALARELGRPAPLTVAELYVNPSSEEVYDFADAFIIAFGARLAVAGRKPSCSDVVATISPSGREAYVEFSQCRRPVGPRLRLSRPRQMIKAPKG